MINSTVKLHRVLKAKPKKVFQAFSNPLALAFWIPPYGFLCEIHQMNFIIGGSFKMSFYNFTTQKKHAFGGNYLEIQPNERIVYTDKFEDPNLLGEILTTITFEQVSCGTSLNIIQEGIPSVIPLELCYLGWQESLEKLMKLVEPEINE